MSLKIREMTMQLIVALILVNYVIIYLTS